ncbi:divalent-cation tolerance protein CutA [Roseospirillum parvum]|uniref:Divalent cation tolerance protein n=1 Tax=Roseospirillum parvum TaxID=83401 RepID=A0A1G7YBV9_9PROT|nr:divalent-cation tolerance protein CutA [Roseospirillum parvum]SDG93480.1 divalent cation tolerance protein [Roseospirillum parvum]
MSYCVVYMTAGSHDEAKEVARTLVEERLAACVNILGAMTSVYRWQDRVTDGEEVALIAKTRQDLVERLTARLAEIHTYDCPCAITLPIEGGHPPFLDWIGEETA